MKACTRIQTVPHRTAYARRILNTVEATWNSLPYRNPSAIGLNIPSTMATRIDAARLMRTARPVMCTTWAGVQPDDFGKSTEPTAVGRRFRVIATEVTTTYSPIPAG